MMIECFDLDYWFTVIVTKKDAINDKHIWWAVYIFSDKSIPKRTPTFKNLPVQGASHRELRPIPAPVAIDCFYNTGSFFITRNILSFWRLKAIYVPN